MTSPLASYARGYYDQPYFPGMGQPPVPPAVPVITSLVPATAVAGSGAQPVTVNGTDFIASSVVDVGATPVATVFVSATELTATVTPVTAGTLQLRVRNVDTGTQSATSPFTVTAAPPLVPAITATQPPSVVAGSAAALLAVAGQRFIASSIVDADGVPVPTVYVSNIRLDTTYTPPATAGTVQLTVRNVAGGTVSAPHPLDITDTTTRSDGPVPGAAAGTMPAADGGTKKRRAT